MANTDFKIVDFINKELPTEILEQLRVADRIQYILKPTSTSAVSTSEQNSDSTSDSIITTDDINKDIDALVDEVKELENLVEQLEDMVDEHLKDMSIPPTNERIAEAVKNLGCGDGNITKDCLDKALAIMDYFPMMSLGTDPVLAALIGNGTVEGPWLDCNEITSNVAKLLKTTPRNDYEADTSIKDQSTEIADKHEKRMFEMMLETLLMLWWNMLWPKTVVDATIINPIRLSVANPTDSLIGFFSKTDTDPVKKRFKKPSPEWLARHGLVNKILTRLRVRLLCIPYKIYPRYKPMVEIIDEKGNKVNCKDIIGDCPTPPEEKEFTEDNKQAMTQMGSMLDEINGGDYCFNNAALLQGINTDLPKGFGTSPECVKSAKIVLDAVLANALTPPDGSKDPAGASSTKSTILGVT